MVPILPLIDQDEFESYFYHNNISNSNTLAGIAALATAARLGYQAGKNRINEKIDSFRKELHDILIFIILYQYFIQLL